MLLTGLFEEKSLGIKRAREIAMLLWEYMKKFDPWHERTSLERAQQLTSLIYLEPENAKSWLDRARDEIGSDATESKQWYIAMLSEYERQEELKKIEEEKNSKFAEILKDAVFYHHGMRNPCLPTGTMLVKGKIAEGWGKSPASMSA